jgi:hypothetical protein
VDDRHRPLDLGPVEFGQRVEEPAQGACVPGRRDLEEEVLGEPPGEPVRDRSLEERLVRLAVDGEAVGLEAGVVFDPEVLPEFGPVALAVVCRLQRRTRSGAVPDEEVRPLECRRRRQRFVAAGELIARRGEFLTQARDLRAEVVDGRAQLVSFVDERVALGSRSEVTDASADRSSRSRSSGPDSPTFGPPGGDSAVAGGSSSPETDAPAELSVTSPGPSAGSWGPSTGSWGSSTGPSRASESVADVVSPPTSGGSAVSAAVASSVADDSSEGVEVVSRHAASSEKTSCSSLGRAGSDADLSRSATSSVWS